MKTVQNQDLFNLITELTSQYVALKTSYDSLCSADIDSGFSEPIKSEMGLQLESIDASLKKLLNAVIGNAGKDWIISAVGNFRVT